MVLRDRALLLIAAGIFVAVEMMLERAIAGGDEVQQLIPRAFLRVEPALRVIALQRVKHDIEALIHDAAVFQDQHGHCPLGRNLEHFLRLIPQDVIPSH